MKRIHEGNLIPQRYNRLTFFFIEMAYWASFYEKWKSEEKSLMVGVCWVITMMVCNIIMLLEIIQLTSSYQIIDHIIELLPEGFFLLKINGQ